MRTKTEKAVSLFRSGCLKEALTIFRTFRIGFTKEERRTLQIAYESLTGNKSFYQQIGIDTDSMISKSVRNVGGFYLYSKAPKRVSYPCNSRSNHTHQRNRNHECKCYIGIGFFLLHLPIHLPIQTIPHHNRIPLLNLNLRHPRILAFVFIFRHLYRLQRTHIFQAHIRLIKLNPCHLHSRGRYSRCVYPTPFRILFNNHRIHLMMLCNILLCAYLFRSTSGKEH